MPDVTHETADPRHAPRKVHPLSPRLALGGRSLHLPRPDPRRGRRSPRSWIGDRLRGGTPLRRSLALARTELPEGGHPGTAHALRPEQRDLPRHRRRPLPHRQPPGPSLHPSRARTRALGSHAQRLLLLLSPDAVPSEDPEEAHPRPRLLLRSQGKEPDRLHPARTTGLGETAPRALRGDVPDLHLAHGGSREGSHERETPRRPRQRHGDPLLRGSEDHPPRVRLLRPCQSDHGGAQVQGRAGHDLGPPQALPGREPEGLLPRGTRGGHHRGPDGRGAGRHGRAGPGRELPRGPAEPRRRRRHSRRLRPASSSPGPAFPSTPWNWPPSRPTSTGEAAPSSASTPSPFPESPSS